MLVSFVYYYYYYYNYDYRVFEFSVDGPSIIIKSQTFFQIKIKKILNIIITTRHFPSSEAIFFLILSFNIKFILH